MNLNIYVHVYQDACIAILEIINLYILGEKIKYKYASPVYMYLYLNLATHY